MLALAQLARVSRINPAVRSDLQAPGEVKAVLQRACYDCHSSQTRWRWYTGVAPISWLASRDVVEGRKRLDFSNWGAYLEDPGTAINKLAKIRDQARNGDMPPWYYRAVHPEARLSAADRDRIAGWANREIIKLSSSGQVSGGK